ncbi:MAG: hypothetical protein AAF646_14560 [Pseudomonadota bacterium]
MALIHDIQAALLDELASVGGVLLKLRFLAAKLDDNVLEEWVQDETEGYPDDVEVPEYRKAQITYTGSFASFAQQLNNVSIPTYIISKEAGERWVKYEIRDGLPLIEDQTKRVNDKTQFGIDASNLKVLLQDKIYSGMGIVDITSRIDTGAFSRVQHAVRAKTLDFTLKLEKQVPAVAEIDVGQAAVSISYEEQQDVKHLTQQVFLGDVTNIHNTGDNANVTLSVTKGDTESLVRALSHEGIPVRDASELAKIIEHEEPDDAESPVGPKARSWLLDKLGKGASEAWNLGKPVIQKIITEAAKQYYGLG